MSAALTLWKTVYFLSLLWKTLICEYIFMRGKIWVKDLQVQNFTTLEAELPILKNFLFRNSEFTSEKF